MPITQNNPTKIYKDIDISFTRNPNTLDISKKVDVSAVKQALKLLLNTQYYEKPFNPEFGSNIRSLLFDNFSNETSSRLQDEIKTTIDNFEPRVRIESILCDPNLDTLEYDIVISFFIIGIQGVQTLETVLERLR
jgi:phage baseplate assembly protein W